MEPKYYTAVKRDMFPLYSQLGSDLSLFLDFVDSFNTVCEYLFKQ